MENLPYYLANILLYGLGLIVFGWLLSRLIDKVVDFSNQVAGWLIKVIQGCSQVIASLWKSWLTGAKEEWKLDTPRMVFLGLLFALIAGVGIYGDWWILKYSLPVILAGDRLMAWVALMIVASSLACGILVFHPDLVRYLRFFRKEQNLEKQLQEKENRVRNWLTFISGSLGLLVIAIIEARIAVARTLEINPFCSIWEWGAMGLIGLVTPISMSLTFALALGLALITLGILLLMTLVFVPATLGLAIALLGASIGLLAVKIISGLFSLLVALAKWLIGAPGKIGELLDGWRKKREESWPKKIQSKQQRLELRLGAKLAAQKAKQQNREKWLQEKIEHRRRLRWIRRNPSKE